MQKAPKNTGYREDVLHRGVTTSKEDGLAGRHGAGQRKTSLVACGSLLFVGRSWLVGRLQGGQATGTQRKSISICFSEGKLRHQPSTQIARAS